MDSSSTLPSNGAAAARAATCSAGLGRPLHLPVPPQALVPPQAAPPQPHLPLMAPEAAAPPALAAAPVAALAGGAAPRAAAFAAMSCSCTVRAWMATRCNIVSSSTVFTGKW